MLLWKNRKFYPSVCFYLENATKQRDILTAIWQLALVNRGVSDKTKIIIFRIKAIEKIKKIILYSFLLKFFINFPIIVK